jgi:thiamine-monophosphate kinase
MIDISDGLASDLTRLAKESDKGAVVWEEKLPVALSSKTVAKTLKESFLKWALYGGEDYELLFTVPPAKRKLVEEELSFSCSLIGEVVDKREGISIINKRGTRARIEGGGYDHFSKKDDSGI